MRRYATVNDNDTAYGTRGSGGICRSVLRAVAICWIRAAALARRWYETVVEFPALQANIATRL